MSGWVRGNGVNIEHLDLDHGSWQQLYYSISEPHQSQAARVPNIIALAFALTEPEMGSLTPFVSNSVAACRSCFDVIGVGLAGNNKWAVRRCTLCAWPLCIQQRYQVDGYQTMVVLQTRMFECSSH